MKSSNYSIGSGTEPSVDTTYLVQNNSSLDLEHQTNESFSDLESAIADYSAIITDIKYVYQLKRKIFDEALQIEKVNAENNELVQRISETVIIRDNNMFQLQIEQVALEEQHQMLARLLTMAKKAQEHEEGPELEKLLSEDFEQLIYKPFKGKRMTKAQAIGLMGGLDRYRENDEACEYCCLNPQAVGESGENSLTSKEDEETEFIPPDPSVVAPASSQTNRVLSYQSRIESLLLETRGLEALLTHRMGELEASELRLQSTLSKEESEAEYNLGRVEAAKNDIMKKAAHAEVRYERLESDNAILAVKGVTDNLKTKKATDHALRTARREVEIFNITKERELEKALRETERDSQAVIQEYTKEQYELTERIRERGNWVNLLDTRISQFEERLRKEGLANGEMRELLAKINGRD